MAETAGRFLARRVRLATAVVALCVVAACERRPEVSEPAEEAAGEVTDAYRLASDGVEGARPRGSLPRATEEADAAGAPSFLPRGAAAGGWTRTQAVRAMELDVVRARFSPALDGAALGEAYACRYEADAGLMVDVLVLRFAGSDEAYGAFSMMGRGEAERATRYVRVDEGADALTMYAWQGEWVAVLRGAPPARGELRRACARLLGRMLLPIPAADPPALLAALVPGGGVDVQPWPMRARSVRSLQPQIADVLSSAQAAALDEVLGLDGTAVLVTGQMSASEADEFNLIWLVAYPSGEAATAAWERYQEARLDGQRNLPTTILTDAAGRYLLGSWSPEQESTMHLLPRLRNALRAD